MARHCPGKKIPLRADDKFKEDKAHQRLKTNQSQRQREQRGHEKYCVIPGGRQIPQKRQSLKNRDHQTGADEDGGSGDELGQYHWLSLARMEGRGKQVAEVTDA